MPLNRTSGNLLDNILGDVKERSRFKERVNKKIGVGPDHPVRSSVSKKPVERSVSTSFVNVREKRQGSLYIRISDSTRRKLDTLCRLSNSSQATVIESLIDAAMDGKIMD